MLSLPPPNGAMQVLAKSTSHPVVALQITDAPVLSKHGMSNETIRTHVEASLRRCGFSVSDSGPLEAAALIVLAGLDEESRGYSGSAILGVQIIRTVEGVPYVPLAVFTDGVIFSGPPGTAGIQTREALSSLLDSFCNLWLQARDSAPVPKRRR
jgi:hypothetical protein